MLCVLNTIKIYNTKNKVYYPVGISFMIETLKFRLNFPKCEIIVAKTTCKKYFLTIYFESCIRIEREKKYYNIKLQ